MKIYLSLTDRHVLGVIARSAKTQRQHDLTPSLHSEDAKTIRRLLLGENETNVRISRKDCDNKRWDLLMSHFHEIKKVAENHQRPNSLRDEKFRRSVSKFQIASGSKHLSYRQLGL